MASTADAVPRDRPQTSRRRHPCTLTRLPTICRLSRGSKACFDCKRLVLARPGDPDCGAEQPVVHPCSLKNSSRGVFHPLGSELGHLFQSRAFACLRAACKQSASVGEGLKRRLRRTSAIRGGSLGSHVVYRRGLPSAMYVKEEHNASSECLTAETHRTCPNNAQRSQELGQPERYGRRERQPEP
eukprot:scaffold233_cov243-Pinguiococcus_pyrenoidosus.AAC.2